MMHFTQKVSGWMTSALLLVMFTVSMAANALDFGPTPTKFSTTKLDGSYVVKFSVCADAGMSVTVAGNSQFDLCDAAGQTVAQVSAAVKDNYEVSLTVSGAEQAASGTYFVEFPAAAFCLSWQPNVTSDAFRVELEYAGEEGGDGGDIEEGGDTGEGEGGDTGEGEGGDTGEGGDNGEGEGGNTDASTAVFDYTHGQIPTVVNGVTSTTTSTYAEGEYGYGLQLRDGKTLSFSAPEGMVITSIVLHRPDGAPNNYMYLECNEGSIVSLDGGLYIDVEWTGAASTVVFTATMGMTAWVGTATVTFASASGISAVANAEAQSAIYDLAGRRVREQSKGLFIQNGVKVVR